MKQTASVFALTLICLASLDGLVALGLNWAERSNRLGSLVQYFEYGRSVPGKLEQWQAQPGTPGNLFKVAWRSEIVAKSETAFQEEPADTPPVIRSYGMSFVNKILSNSVKQNPELIWDFHSGPGSPPNFTYSLFQDDRANRNPGDIVVLGILSSSLPAMAALSNRTWAFEQPGPFTYPIYRFEQTGLRRVDPLINSTAEQRDVMQDPQAAQAWADQLAQEDAFFAPQTFAATWLDVSPFARLVRRSLAKSHVEGVKDDILQNERYPYADVLQHIVREFADIARSDGQIPVVMLIQSRARRDPDVLTLVQPILEDDGIPYFATIEHFDPRDPAGFLPDGHYQPHVDKMFGTKMLDVLEKAQADGT